MNDEVLRLANGGLFKRYLQRGNRVDVSKSQELVMLFNVLSGSSGEEGQSWKYSAKPAVRTVLPVHSLPT